MATPSAPNCTAADSQHMAANGSPASETVPLETPRDDIRLERLESGGPSVPSTRLIELEMLLRQRDAQNEKLTVGRLWCSEIANSY